MRLEELVEQWRSSAPLIGDPSFANGTLDCADDLEDFIRHHEGETV